MSEIPALRDALVAAAARRARRRRRIAVRATAWTATTAAAAVLLAVALSQPGDRARERAATVPHGKLLEDAFPVFARPARPGDGAPGLFGAPAGNPYQPVPAVSVSRRVADEDGAKAWLVAGRTAADPRVCIVLRTSTTIRAQCAGFAAAQRRGIDVQLGSTALIVAPAGSTDLRVRFGTGPAGAPRLVDGAALVRGTRKLVAAGFTAPDGTRIVRRYSTGTALDVDRPCPGLGPLPAEADAQAARTALIAVDDIYPFVTEAKVTGVKPLAGDLCPGTLIVSLRITQPGSSRSDSLSQGRLLLGMIGGRMSVWREQH